MLFGRLIEYLDPFSIFGRILNRQPDAMNSIFDVNEGSSLAAGAVHRKWVADSCLHYEAI